jgi:GrpB-like predicted nucleotidyltransferase (UPF0157 family)
MVLGLPAGEVRLREAHGAWAEEFRAEKTRVVAAIGTHILDVQHVGSTAIAGVPAKPVLDLLVGVASFEDATVCITPLETLGYRYRGEYGIPRRHYFVKGDPRTHHLHMVESASEQWRTTIRFRDLLKSDPESARAYALAKSALAAKYPRDRAAYQREKDAVVERLLGSNLRP